ncbi:hypothetical protein PS15p_203162 [Mucor circinelloides]
MNVEFDYSMYTTLCIVEISFTANTLLISGSNNRITASTQRYLPVWYMRGPLDFYFSEENCDIVFGRIMQAHYKKHPPKERYIHIANFMEELHQIHQSQNYKNTVYSAIVKFLTLIYPRRLQEARGALKRIQCMFVLPDKYVYDEQFLKETLRPTLEKAAWLSKNDNESKALYISNWMDVLYYYQSRRRTLHDTLKLQREKKYMICNIQKMAKQSKLLVTINTARMVYDPDFAKASLTLLDENTPLVPKILDTVLSTELPFDCSLDKMKKVAKLLFVRVFAASPNDTIGDDTLTDYYCDNAYYSESFVHDFIEAVEDNYEPKQSIGDALQYFYQDKHPLTAEQIEKMSKIKYQELYAIFEDENWKIVTDSIAEYLKCNSRDENISGVVINTENREEYGGLLYHPSRGHYGDFHNQLLTRCCSLYLNMIRQALASGVSRLNMDYNKLYPSTTHLTRTEGCLYKVHKMIDLANKLSSPVVAESTESNLHGMPQNEFEFDGIIDQLQSYQYYVNVIISSTNTIEMSLKQVIETSISGNEYEKSTLSILDHICNMDDFFSAICDNLWNNLMPQGNDDMDFSVYDDFKSRLTNYLETILVDQSIRITDLDEGLNIGLHHPSYQLPMAISHRAIMDIGIAPYLSTIVSSIITSLEDKNLFGKYKARVAIVTGSLLYQWLYEFQPAYSNFIWHQLITALASQTYLKQTTTSIVLTKDYVRKHHCFEYVPYEREKYQQVLSKSFFVEVEHIAGPQAEVYINHGTFYERAPHKKMSNGLDTWVIQLLQGQVEVVSQHAVKKSIYLRLKGGLSELSSTTYKTLNYSII